jgi:hypothetical protein
VAVYILEESISQLIKTEKNQTPKPMPFFSLTEKTDLNERDMIKPDGSITQNKIRDNATYINVEAINNAELTKYFKPQNILL